MTPVLFGAMVSGTALACPGKGDADTASADSVVPGSRPGNCTAEATDKVDPAHCSRRMVGPESCAWTTSMMAQRVLEEGAPWTYVGRLAPTDTPLPSKVAAPFTVGPQQRIHVVANEVLELLDRTSPRVELTGRLLEVDGIRYFVATALTPASS